MSFLKTSQNDGGVVDAFMRMPGRYLPFTELLAGIMSGPSELPGPAREMIALHVSELNDCLYCVQSHTAVLLAGNISVSVVKAAQSGKSHDPEIQAALTFAGKLTRSPGAITQTDVDAVLAAGLCAQAVEDIIAVVGLFSYLNRLVDGIGLVGDEAAIIQGGAMIAEHGYQPVVGMVRAEAGKAA